MPPKEYLLQHHHRFHVTPISLTMGENAQPSPNNVPTNIGVANSKVKSHVVNIVQTINLLGYLLKNQTNT